MKNSFEQCLQRFAEPDLAQQRHRKHGRKQSARGHNQKHEHG
jgi:hypothetical protein